MILPIFTWINSMYRVYLKIDGKEAPVTWENKKLQPLLRGITHVLWQQLLKDIQDAHR
jgi:hypothetical protein